jgi:hypothetical protein
LRKQQNLGNSIIYIYIYIYSSRRACSRSRVLFGGPLKCVSSQTSCCSCLPSSWSQPPLSLGRNVFDDEFGNHLPRSLFLYKSTSLLHNLSSSPRSKSCRSSHLVLAVSGESSPSLPSPTAWVWLAASPYPPWPIPVHPPLSLARPADAERASPVCAPAVTRSVLSLGLVPDTASWLALAAPSPLHTPIPALLPLARQFSGAAPTGHGRASSPRLAPSQAHKPARRCVSRCRPRSADGPLMCARGATCCSPWLRPPAGEPPASLLSVGAAITPFPPWPAKPPLRGWDQQRRR